MSSLEKVLYCPPKLAFFHNEKWRYKVAYGGRGSGKSWALADALIIASTQERLRILCAREFQKSISESVHHLLVEQIDILGWSPLFDVQKSSIVCKETGSEFLFAGLRHNISSLKSMEGIDRCWVEEAETVSENSWSVLIPTIRKPGSEIWLSFNPAQQNDPTYQRFIANPPKGRCKSALVNWEDNPFLPEVLREEAEHLRATDPSAYEHIWHGSVWTRSDAQIFDGKWCVDYFTPDPKKWQGPYFGADWGFSKDPTTLVRMWIYDGSLHVEHEAYKVKCDISDTPALFDTVPDSRRYQIRADCARPETINHVRKAGFRIEGAPKGPGSVEDGISFLRSFNRIVIHPRCKHMAEEARLYSYKTDKLTGDVLPDIVDAHNHLWDAIRYALSPLIRAGGMVKCRDM